MHDKPFRVQPTAAAVLAASRLPTIGERTTARQYLLDQAPFPAQFADFAEAKQAADAAGPEFEVVVQS